MSLNCVHQRTYCSSHRLYMSTERHGGMTLTGKNRRTRIQTCPNATLPTTNPTWTDPEANPGPRDERDRWLTAWALTRSCRLFLFFVVALCMTEFVWKCFCLLDRSWYTMTRKTIKTLNFINRLLQEFLGLAPDVLRTILLCKLIILP
jgi:hypothetical protein